MKNAGKARSYGLYRHLRTSKEIIENLLNYYNKNKYYNVDYTPRQAILPHQSYPLIGDNFGG